MPQCHGPEMDPEYLVAAREEEERVEQLAREFFLTRREARNVMIDIAWEERRSQPVEVTRWLRGE